MNRTWSVGITLGLLGAAVGYFLPKHADEPALPAAGVESHRIAPSEELDNSGDVAGEVSRVASLDTTPPPAAAPTSAVLAALPPLPAAELPLAQQLDVLTERAQKGDGTAACRLTLLGSQCQAQARGRQFAATIEQGLSSRDPSGQDELLIRAAAASVDGQKSSAERCDGVDIERVPSPDSYLASAVADMSVRQKVALAMMRPDGSLSLLPRQPSSGVRSGRDSNYLVPQFLADNDLRFLQQGIAAADPLALEGLLQVHSPSRLPGSLDGMRLSMPNPYQFALYGTLMQRLFGSDVLGMPVEDTLSRTLASMSSNTITRLNSDVEQLEARWLAVSQHKNQSVDVVRRPDDVAWCGED